MPQVIGLLTNADPPTTPAFSLSHHAAVIHLHFVVHLSHLQLLDGADDGHVHSRMPLSEVIHRQYCGQVLFGFDRPLRYVSKSCSETEIANLDLVPLVYSLVKAPLLGLSVIHIVSRQLDYTIVCYVLYLTQVLLTVAAILVLRAKSNQLALVHAVSIWFIPLCGILNVCLNVKSELPI